MFGFTDMSSLKALTGDCNRLHFPFAPHLLSSTTKNGESAQPIEVTFTHLLNRFETWNSVGYLGKAAKENVGKTEDPSNERGTFVEGIKEEVVLSPAHALSLIASGEEHRHEGSNNFNLLSSRSHTIFTLHLIDLAGSESSKTETTGLRRKEGSYINKSLLTLSAVISKLTDGKSSHVPYRDSKLTRLLQSYLSGHGRVSLICTVTPASSNTEETHNTLKFAHRSKHIEIKASQNKILDEKSLIKKYQREIHTKARASAVKERNDR
ncbi:Kinesin-like protein KIN-7E [Salvia divinorum]|uniref:Kinesin-like protein KIN-7E n=1 Tax=Salvia divinorum TaxID=28513 RepID=A0ABD1FX01_SALDI